MARHGWGPATVVAFVAVAAFLNTLPAGFTFDDSVAVVKNADVTADAAPLSALFKHDFWGQDITLRGSHKSYRPLTVLALRLTRRAWALLQDAVPLLRALLPPKPALSQLEDAPAPAPVPGLHPFPMHALCVALHTVVSVLVLALAQHLFAKLEQLTAGSPQPAAGSETSHTSKQQSQAFGNSSTLELWLLQPCWRAPWQLWQVPVTARGRAQALLAALLFALHPVHTEAVASIVGCAELLSAAWSLITLLVFFAAVDRSSSASSGGGTPSRGAARNPAPAPAAKAKRGSKAAAAPSAAPAHQEDGHWLLVLAACGAALLAALSKEIGITVVATAAMYDLLLQPASLASPAACRRQLVRITLLAATGLAYIKLRSWVAVEQLIRVRKIENPLVSAETCLARALSTGYLHARYAWLLLAPIQLSADWSFNCVPLVQQVFDLRCLATLTLYAWLAWVVLAARPLVLARQLWATMLRALASGSASSGPTPSPAPAPAPAPALALAPAPAPAPAAPAATPQQWRLLVVAGLMAAPFLPASNVFFYVGTFIGERLLYFPSIGFCLLAAEALGAGLAGQPVPQAGAAAAARGPQPGAGRRRWLLAAVGLLLAGYAGRTLTRNMDWWDNRHVFGTAVAVCPGSAKAHQLYGQELRRSDPTQEEILQALEHFRRAQEIDPSYCSPRYYLALSALNLRNVTQGLAGIRDSLECTDTAPAALESLNEAYALRFKAQPDNASLCLEWAELLAEPHVLQVQEACAAAEEAALMDVMSGSGTQQFVDSALAVCKAAMAHWSRGVEPDTFAGRTLPHQAGVNISQLQECLSVRGELYAALASSKLQPGPVQAAVYRYLRQVAEHAACRTTAGGGHGVAWNWRLHRASAAASPSSHLKVVRRFVDAQSQDPWLQAELGAALLALHEPKRADEAAQHLVTAANTFSRIHASLASITTGRGALALDGSPLTPQRALAAAAQPLERFLAAPASAGAATKLRCDIQAGLCQLRVMEAQSARAAEDDGSLALAAANAAVQRCQRQLRKLPGCRQH